MAHAWGCFQPLHTLASAVRTLSTVHLQHALAKIAPVTCSCGCAVIFQCCFLTACPCTLASRDQALVQSLLPTTEHVDPLPAATARSCLPHWLEAAGWAAALMSDATAAAMGRLHSTRRGEAPVHIMQGVSYCPPAIDV